MKDTKRKLTVSVCMATYNGKKFIDQQLDSILNQLQATDELIISDDHSSDGTWELLQNYQTNDPRIKLFQNPQQGIRTNVENAILHSQNEIIFLSDQDDVWQPEKVATIVTLFTQQPQTQVIISDLVIVDDQLKPLEASYQKFRRTRSGFWPNLLRSSYIGAGMAFRAELKKLILPIPEKVPMHDMWIGLLADRQKKVQFITAPLVLYRRHALNASEIATTSSRWQQFKWRFHAYQEVRKREREFRKNS